jgi:hypothetical protein
LPAPRAKIRTQRQRRLAYTDINIQTNQYCINPLEITVGTEFMQDMKNVLCYFATSYLADKTNPVNFISWDMKMTTTSRIFQSIFLVLTLLEKESLRFLST